MITRLKFWWEVDKTVHPMGHKIRVRSNKSRGFALYTRLCLLHMFPLEIKSEDRDTLGETISFLEILGSLYDTFGIHSKGMKLEAVSLKQAKQNVTKIDNYVRGTVSKVKERYRLSETSAMNGPQGTVSQKTQMAVSLLKKRMDRLYMNVMDVNPEFADDILLETLPTTQVENLHAVSHFKHETFMVLQYAQDFGTIVKESIKRTSRWAAKYYRHDRSYYPVPQSAVPLSAVATMAPLPSEGKTPGMEEQIKEWLESYRPGPGCSKDG